MIAAAVVMLLAAGLAGLFCIAGHICRSGFPAVSLWFFRPKAHRPPPFPGRLSA
jgi:hypothetical protein